ncbi:hypothetical protein [Methanobacterium spitsbergense]|uniref:Uncharacterized protein n=1 Tax=Methanobacterium spitsbergense TaxID=2874285 RepID=A0A8T5UWA1_9EURY|nr:hypothetical protein [Methanobacterium spitsbergense]MBZ2165123.1 hypothetical protein [Methanobacterium spitsbergense]
MLFTNLPFFNMDAAMILLVLSIFWKSNPTAYVVPSRGNVLGPVPDNVCEVILLASFRVILPVQLPV